MEDVVRILAIGHSHLHKLSAAYATSQSRDIEMQFLTLGSDWSAFANRTDVGFEINPQFQQKVEELIRGYRPHCVLLALSGSQHFTNSAVRDPRPFDFVLPSRADIGIDPSVAAVPYNLVKRIFDFEVARLHDTMLFVKPLVEHLYCLGTPPVVGEQEHFFNHLAPEMKARVPVSGLSTPSERYKMWRLADDVLRDWCKTNGAQHLGPPDGTCDDTGFLKKELFADSLHANLAYANWVLKQLGDLAATRQGQYLSASDGV